MTSAVADRANRRPTAVASGPSSGMRSVPACLINRDRRACLAGLRKACAKAVAGMVMRMPRSVARARSMIIRRSCRSSAMRPPASKVMPLTQLFLFSRLSWVAGKRAERQPRPAPFLLADHRFAAVLLPASPATLPRRTERFGRRASRRQKRSRPDLLRPEREFS